MGKGAISIGAACVLGGLFGVYKVVINPEVTNWLLVHLAVLILIGILLIGFNKEEDKIEKRKDIKE